MKTEKRGSNWTAYYDPDTKRYFAEIMYTSREGREQYDYEITQDIYGRLGTFQDDVENERLIKTAKMTYSFENTMWSGMKKPMKQCISTRRKKKRIRKKPANDEFCRRSAAAKERGRKQCRSQRS